MKYGLKKSIELETIKIHIKLAKNSMTQNIGLPLRYTHAPM